MTDHPQHDHPDPAGSGLEPVTLTGGSADLEGRGDGVTAFADADLDDTPILGAARLRDQAVARRRRRILLWLLLGVGLALVTFGDFAIGRTLIALAAAWILFTLGFATIGMFARPAPEPPPPGELRPARLQYRCPSCGTELRLTMANDEVPEAPRHCSGEMDLLKNLLEDD
ncbi:MAG: hypothetical protein GY929_07380 [Actinomycetia bacterium]|nr:hypothetical protein [Actinomycetes bacterium]